MDANLQKAVNAKIKNTIDNLNKNGIKAVYVPSRIEAVALLESMLVPGETIACGGSVTLFEAGAINLVKNGNYRFIDGFESGITLEETDERLKKSLFADTYLMSSNAITETGCLYNVDGTSNRVTALLFGPTRVIILAGYNKIVATLSEAVSRVKNIVAPANAIRLGFDTYCAKHGHCFENRCDKESLMTVPTGACENTICCNSVVSGQQRQKDRITVIIIGEELGY